MYTKYYGLNRKPFLLTPDPNTVFLSETHEEGLAILKYGILSKKTFLVLTAEVGSGKTTLLQALIDSIDNEVHLCLLNNPTLYRDEFFSHLARELKLPWNGNKADLLHQFRLLLQKCYKTGEQVLLIIDEAHVLPVDLLEEVRLLSNLQEKGQDVLSIFLVGQPELNEQMSDDRLLPLRQRIGIRFHLTNFNLEETRQYILFRLRRAGARNLGVFNEEAIRQIHKVSKGTPRLINIMCDHALITGFAVSKPVIDPDIVKECVEELHFPGEDNPLPIGRVNRSTIKRYVIITLVLLLTIITTLIVFEVIPATRNYSLLQKIVPANWIQWLH